MHVPVITLGQVQSSANASYLDANRNSSCFINGGSARTWMQRMRPYRVQIAIWIHVIGASLPKACSRTTFQALTSKWALKMEAIGESFLPLG